MNPSSDQQRRKRKQQRFILRQSLFSLQHFLSVRSFVLCFTFLTFLYLLSPANPFGTSSFHPVLVVPSLSLLSSSSDSSPAEPLQDFGTFLSPLEVENRVFFPDHVLLLLSGGNNDGLMKNHDFSHELECVYFSKNRNESNNFSVHRSLSVDEYHQFRFSVRCPLPISVDYSADAYLRWTGGKNRILLRGVYEKKALWLNYNNNKSNKSSCSWDNVVYEAALDGSTVVMFVKGLNLRANKLSDPSEFTCHFGLQKSDMNSNNRYKLVRTNAFTAAQEVVRCPLPRVIQTNPGKFEEIFMTVGLRRNFQPGLGKSVLMPSVAKVFDQMSRKKVTREEKYELCMCTMVWNQAWAIREWIKYHSWLGVERWFVYDNNSDDGLDRVIQELDLKNYNVTRHVWPWIKTQEAGFSHCALRARDECNWVAFMDVDEYFYFPQRARESGYVARNSLRTLVSNFSSVSRQVAEIRTSCHSFGPSGLNERPVQGVTVGYTCRLLSPMRHKSIVRVDALDPSLLNVVHHFRLKKRFEYMNLPQSIGIINHYKYQVWEVFRAKFHRRVATYVADWRENQNEGSRDRVPGLGTEAVEPPNWARRFCEVWDTGLRDFVLSNLVDFSTGLLPWEGKYGLE